MATSVQSAPQAAPTQRPAAPSPQPVKAVPAAAPAALIPVAAEPAGRRGGIPEDSPALRMKVELEVSVPVVNFRVRRLLALEPGAVVESGWSHGGDLPLSAGRVQLAWTEFEVVDTQLAARLTRLN